MSDNLAGVTFLAFGNGSPDIFSTFAAMSTNSGSLAVGELIGAATFITAVIAGSIAFIRPFKVGRKSFVRDVCFFIIAASFSLIFLADGKLTLWESCVLVALYVFYVIFVLIWHWWIHRRRAKRQKEAAAREHFLVPGNEDVDTSQQYHDDEEEGTVGRGSRHGTIRGVSVEDLAALEQDNETDDEAAEEQVEHATVVINRNMRLSRPHMGRRNTHVAIRPSLVGALEYRALLAELQKSGNIHSMPIHLRRYSDDPRPPPPQISTSTEPQTAPAHDSHDDQSAFLRPEPQGRTATGSRLRAVSVNDVDALRMEPSTLPRLETPDLLGPVNEDDASGRRDGPSTAVAEASSSLRPPSPSISLSPPSSDHGSTGSFALPRRTPTSPTFLAPPDPFQQNVLSSAKASSSEAVSPRSQSPKPREYPKVSIPQDTAKSPPRSPFPTYTDEIVLSPAPKTGSIRLPPPSLSPDSHFPGEFTFGDDRRPLKWWPYAALPAPEHIGSTLFPTLCRWREKNIWQKLIGLISAPSVLILTITLPVVETSRDDDDEDEDVPDLSLPGTISSHDHAPRPKAASSGPERADSTTPLLMRPQRGERSSSSGSHGLGGHGDVATVAVSAEQHHERAYPEERVEQVADREIVDSPEQMPTQKDDGGDPNDWNRWLVIIQTFTAPFFMVLIIWANTDQEHPKALIRPTLIALLASCVGLLLLLATTTPARPPKWRIVLCLLGFAVSIAWISTIANEVVGVLKTLGVILNISDAILGLTIFAVGNSCGDLVANITVAKLGYPVMALSACFGGPMLNILLGIGLSGMYLILTAAGDRVDREHKKWKLKPYHIDVSKTLLISGATLLVTLLMLLVIVPIKRWKMDRSLGWLLIGIWLVSTGANVGVEMSGLGTASSS